MNLNKLNTVLPQLLFTHQAFARQFFHPVVRRPVTQQGQRTPILFYSQVAWDTVWQRPQEQAMGLAQYRPVVFVSPVQIHERATRLADRWKFVQKFQGGRLTVLSPLILSGEYRSHLIRQQNQRILRLLLGSFRSCGDFLFMTNSPFSSHLIPHLKPKGVIYDLIDNFCGFQWSPPESYSMEDQLIASTDLGFAGTGFLEQEYKNRINGLEYLPSGVQFERLATPCPEPPELKKMSGPKILYVGTLNDRLNGQIFADLAKAFPEGNLVVVGPVHGTFKSPPLPKNVHFLGLKPHEQLPGYFQHCDLGIMPFADTPAAQAINPIKTLEYLACGLPVLSTPVPDVVKYYQGVVRSENPEKWVQAAKEILENDCPQQKQQRIEFARHRSWDNLIKEMEKRIRRLEKKLSCISSS